MLGSIILGAGVCPSTFFFFLVRLLVWIGAFLRVWDEVFYCADLIRLYMSFWRSCCGC